MQTMNCNVTRPRANAVLRFAKWAVAQSRQGVSGTRREHPRELNVAAFKWRHFELSGAPLLIDNQCFSAPGVDMRNSDDQSLGSKLILGVGALGTISYALATADQALYGDSSQALVWSAVLAMGLVLTVLAAAAVDHCGNDS
jgi:hypothetical protein